MLLFKLALTTLLTIVSAQHNDNDAWINDQTHDNWDLNPTSPGIDSSVVLPSSTCPCNNGVGSTGSLHACAFGDHCASCNRGYELITEVDEILGTTSSLCDECPAGKYQDVAGVLSCKECPPGFVSEVAAMECTACLAGKYQDDAVDLSCKECPVGKFQDQTNQESCMVCNAGMYNDQTGQQSCIHCEDGKTTVKGTNSAAADCAAPLTQADVEAAYAAGAASVTPEDGIGQADVDAARAAGAASVKASELELVEAYKELKNC